VRQLPDIQPDADAQAGLVEALRLDPSLCWHSGRLQRALADLAPHDERGRRLVVLGADLGVPGLLDLGLAAEAHARLVDRAGCRSDVANWVISAWRSARELSADAEQPAGGLPNSATPVAIERPGQPTCIQLAVWPDGTPSVAIITLDGAFVLADARLPAAGAWRRVASPRTPMSRDIALALGADPGEVAWSDRDGIYARTLRRPGSPHPGVVGLGDARCLASPAVGQQPRYPLAALTVCPGSLDVIWTADQRQLTCAQSRAWAPAAPPIRLPPACKVGERLTGLDVAVETIHTAWLTCITDRGRVLLARWDTSAGFHGSWISLDLPARHVVAVTVASLQGDPTVIAATSDGNLLSADARAAGGRDAWHSIDRPAGVRRLSVVRAISAGSAENDGWLAIVGDDTVWLQPIERHRGMVQCGPGTPLWLGE
jgi:hypothetical protein